MEGPRLGPGGEDITWPDQVAPRGRKASSTRKMKPQTSNPEGSPEIAEGSDHSEGSPEEKHLRGLSEPSQPGSEDERLRRSDYQEEEEDEAPEEDEGE